MCGFTLFLTILLLPLVKQIAVMTYIINNLVYACVCFTAGYAPAVGLQQQSSHNQAQAVLGTYSPITSHQRSMVQVNTEHPKVSFCVRLERIRAPKEALSSLENACGGKFFSLTLLFFSLSFLCREVFQCPIPKVKL